MSEHWNNPIDKQYSHKLGTWAGIELTCPAKADFDGDSAVRCADLAACFGQWLETGTGLSGDVSSAQGDGMVNLRDFAVWACYWTLRPPAVEPDSLPADEG